MYIYIYAMKLMEKLILEIIQLLSPTTKTVCSDFGICTHLIL